VRLMGTTEASIFFGVVLLGAAREQIDAVIALLAARFAQCFAMYARRRKPLKIGLHHDIVAALGGTVDRMLFAHVMCAYNGESVLSGAATDRPLADRSRRQRRRRRHRRGNGAGAAAVGRHQYQAEADQGEAAGRAAEAAAFGIGGFESGSAAAQGGGRKCCWSGISGAPRSPQRGFSWNVVQPPHRKSLGKLVICGPILRR
jgi:hypothetical protein